MSAQQPDGSTAVHIDSIIVRGNARQAVPVVLADFGIRPGDLVTRRNIQRGLKRLYATRQYDDIVIFARGADPSHATLIVDVVERPFIIKYEFRGLQHASAGTVRDSARLEPRTPLSPASVYEAEARIRSELARRGYVRARIDTSLVPTDRAGEYKLIFNIEEGRRIVVARLDFEGNGAVRDGDLRSAMTVRPEGFLWWKKGEFREEDYNRDLESNLARFYGSKGYLDFQVLGDTMIVDPETGKTHVVVRVSEGPQYRVADFQIEGNSHFPSEILEARYNLGGGSLLSGLPLLGGGPSDEDPVFDTGEWREATDRVRRLHTNSGYLYVQVEPIMERLPDGEDGNPRVALKWRITENELALVSLVGIGGNTTTHERVIRERVVMLPGDVYAENRVVSSYQTIQGLGFFEPLPPQDALDVRPNDVGNINVTFKVKERQTGNINFGASLSPTGGVAGFLGYEQPNLFGQAKVGRFRWIFGSRTNDIELGYTDPSVFGSRNSLGMSIRSSRDRFSFVGLGRRRQTGGRIRYGTPLFGSRWTRVSLSYSLFRDDYDDQDQDELDFDQRQLLSIGTRSSIELRIARDTRNH
ncbi:MAG: POTRA domain-containing protein, partial [Gemmatimonadota bacterium]